MRGFWSSFGSLVIGALVAPSDVRWVPLTALMVSGAFLLAVAFAAWRRWLRLPAGPFILAVALVAVAPMAAQAAGYETRSGSTSTSTTDSVSGVPVPGGGTRTRSTSTSASDSFSRSRPVYDSWERANMTASTAVNVVGAMQSIAGLLGGIGAGPVVATPTGVYAPNSGGYGGGYGYGYGYNGGQQVPPFVYQRAASAPPAPVCYPQGCYVWTQGGWQWMPATQPAPTVTVQVGPAQPACGWAQRTDGRGFYWQEYLCR